MLIPTTRPPPPLSSTPPARSEVSMSLRISIVFATSGIMYFIISKRWRGGHRISEEDNDLSGPSVQGRLKFDAFSRWWFVDGRRGS